MASTYAPKDAGDYATRYLQNMDLDRILPRILDDVHRHFWMAAPWRWTLGSFPSLTLLGNTQDYTPTVPSDFLYLEDARLVDGKNTRHLHIAAYLPSANSYIVGQPSQIAVQVTTGSTTGARVLPVPGALASGAPGAQILSVYKKVAPKIGRDNMTTPGVMLLPDEYFWVYQEGVLWRAMAWAQDPRAGEVSVQGDKTAYTGQRAVFEDGLQWVQQIEKLNRADTQEDQR